MTSLKTALFILFALNMNSFYAQNLKSHQWENRLLLVIVDDINSKIYNNQIIELKRHENGLKDRKLIVYHIKKESYKVGLSKNNDWQKSNSLYKIYKKNSPFETILIGLDGGIKLRQSKLLNCEDLFSIIDVMPMRKSEIKNN